MFQAGRARLSLVCLLRSCLSKQGAASLIAEEEEAAELVEIVDIVVVAVTAAKVEVV